MTAHVNGIRRLVRWRLIFASVAACHRPQKKRDERPSREKSAEVFLIAQSYLEAPLICGAFEAWEVYMSWSLRVRATYLSLCIAQYDTDESVAVVE